MYAMPAAAPGMRKLRGAFGSFLRICHAARQRQHSCRDARPDVDVHHVLDVELRQHAVHNRRDRDRARRRSVTFVDLAEPCGQDNRLAPSSLARAWCREWCCWKATASRSSRRSASQRRALVRRSAAKPSRCNPSSIPASCLAPRAQALWEACKSERSSACSTPECARTSSVDSSSRRWCWKAARSPRNSTSPEPGLCRRRCRTVFLAGRTGSLDCDACWKSETAHSHVTGIITATSSATDSHPAT